MSVPEPTTVLIAPAHTPATRTRSPSQNVMGGSPARPPSCQRGQQAGLPCDRVVSDHACTSAGRPFGRADHVCTSAGRPFGRADHVCTSAERSRRRTTARGRTNLIVGATTQGAALIKSPATTAAGGYGRVDHRGRQAAGRPEPGPGGRRRALRSRLYVGGPLRG